MPCIGEQNAGKMKQWTKNNMRLLSRMRANSAKKKASSRQLETDPRADTPRQMAAVEEASTPVNEGNNEPLYNALNCCAADNTATIGNGGAAGSSAKGSQRSDKFNDNSAPYDESKAIEEQKKSEQPHIIKELFLFFTRRSWKKKLFTVLVCLTVIPVILDLFILRTNCVRGWLDSFLEWMAEYPLWGTWAYVSMVVLTSLIFIPPSILIFASGFTFTSIWGGGAGIPIALLSSFIGSLMGGIIGFWRAKYMTRDLIEVLMRRYPIIKAVDAAIVKNSLRVMVLMRLNCLIPFGVLNYAFGITGVDWAVFALSMVGILPWHLLLVCLGASSATMYDESAQTTLMGVILMATGVAFGIIALAITWKFAKKELQKEVDSTPPTTADDYRLHDRTLTPQRSENRKFPSLRGDRRTSDGGIVKQPVPAAVSVEDSDLHAPDYFLIQWCGEDRGAAEADYGGMEEGLDYQANLTWNEIILDDFS